MADVQTLDDVADAPATQPTSKLMIPVPKAGKGVTVEIDYNELPEDVYIEAMTLGLKELANRKLTKHKSTKDMTGKQAEEAKAAIMKQVGENVADMYAGRVRISGGKVKEKVAGPEVIALAKKIALRGIKDKIKAEGGKIGNYKPATLNAAAKQLVESNPKLIEQAKQALLEQQKAAQGIAIEGIAIEADPELLKASQAADAAKAAKAAAKTKTPKAKKGSEQRANA